MRQRLILLGLLGAFMGAGHGAVAADANAAPSGVAGAVSLAPSCPGPARPGRPCTVPFDGAQVQLRNEAGAVIGKASTMPDGRFKIRAPAGEYEIRIEVTGLYPRCQTTAVTIHKGQIAQVQIDCDSGMR